MQDCNGGEFVVEKSLVGAWSGTFTGDTANDLPGITNFSRIILRPGAIIQGMFLDGGGEVFLEPGAGHQIRGCKLNGTVIYGADVGRVVLEDLYLVNCPESSPAIWLRDSRELNRIAHVECLSAQAAGGGVGGSGIRLYDCDLVHLHDVFAIGFNEGLFIKESTVTASAVTTDFCLTGIETLNSGLILSGGWFQSHHWGVKLWGGTVTLSGVQASGNAFYAIETSGTGKLSVGGCWFAGNSKLRGMSTIGALAQFEKRV